MVEAAANEVSEQVVLDAIAFGMSIKELCALQEEIREQIGKEKAEVPFSSRKWIWIAGYGSTSMKIWFRRLEPARSWKGKAPG